MRTFYLGSDTHWLWKEEFREVPLFVSHRRLVRAKRAFPPSVCKSFGIDSGGFTELSMKGRWETTAEEYVEHALRYRDELGDGLDFISPQDYMCEPWIVEKTGLSVREHQERTVENFMVLRVLAPDLPWIPVLQGWEIDDYLVCLDLYDRAGIDLRAEPTVGVGSVCRRQATSEIGNVFSVLHAEGLSMHGFGVKSAGLKRYGSFLTSADSFAWSYRGRRAPKSPGCTNPGRNCGNCPHFALEWRERVLTALGKDHV